MTFFLSVISFDTLVSIRSNSFADILHRLRQISTRPASPRAHASRSAPALRRTRARAVRFSAELHPARGGCARYSAGAFLQAHRAPRAPGWRAECTRFFAATR